MTNDERVALYATLKAQRGASRNEGSRTNTPVARSRFWWSWLLLAALFTSLYTWRALVGDWSGGGTSLLAAVIFQGLGAQAAFQHREYGPERYVVLMTTALWAVPWLSLWVSDTRELLMLAFS